MAHDPAIAVSNDDHDIRPTIGRERGNRPMWIGISAILVLGAILFTMLETRRTAATAPATRPRAADLSAAPSGIPTLYVPPERIAAPALLPPPMTWSRLPLPQIPSKLTPQVVPPFYVSPNASGPMIAPPISVPLQPPPARADNGLAVVYDSGVGEQITATGTTATTPSGSTIGITATATRARASRAVNRTTIVPQGTLIDAVLETALDSTQPGQARALVSRDVPNLYGGGVLIPRGSQLFGEYRGEIAAGQNRAQVQWTRLVRPDGVAIAIDSPAADRLGRAGIRGRVDTHFLERLGGALLQSSIDIGSAAATRAIGNGTVVVALPGSISTASSQLVGAPPKPTLKVRQGTRISVFVVRDLDFTGVGSQR